MILILAFLFKRVAKSMSLPWSMEGTPRVSLNFHGTSPWLSLLNLIYKTNSTYSYTMAYNYQSLFTQVHNPDLKPRVWYSVVLWYSILYYDIFIFCILTGSRIQVLRPQSAWVNLRRPPESPRLATPREFPENKIHWRRVLGEPVWTHSRLVLFMLFLDFVSPKPSSLGVAKKWPILSNQ